MNIKRRRSRNKRKVIIELINGERHVFTGKSAEQASHIKQIGDTIFFGDVFTVDVEDFQSYLVADTEDERMINDGL